MIVVFDLDDTLYDERTYVKSALMSVAKYLSARIGRPLDKVFGRLEEILERDGRGKVFDTILKEFGIYTRGEVQKCVTKYRTTDPEISLPQVSIACLERFASQPKYVVTDGNKMVQTKKIKALGLQSFFKRTLPTHNFGVDKSKPSTYVFHKILSWEGALPQDLVYIGDNPRKDFVNLKKEGFNTIRVRTGMFAELRMTAEYEAHHEINSLAELDLHLLEGLFT
ncbi:MAG: HAD hydrolase-like protein [Bacteroidota bacterium]